VPGLCPSAFSLLSHRREIDFEAKCFVRTLRIAGSWIPSRTLERSSVNCECEGLLQPTRGNDSSTVFDECRSVCFPTTMSAKPASSSKGFVEYARRI